MNSYSKAALLGLGLGLAVTGCEKILESETINKVVMTRYASGKIEWHEDVFLDVFFQPYTCVDLPENKRGIDIYKKAVGQETIEFPVCLGLNKEACKDLTGHALEAFAANEVSGKGNKEYSIPTMVANCTRLANAFDGKLEILPISSEASQ